MEQSVGQYVRRFSSRSLMGYKDVQILSSTLT